MTVNIKNIIQSIGERARIAADKLVNINGDIKNKALKKTYELIHHSSLELIEENNKDIQNAKSNNLSTAMIDRLTFTQSHINNIILSLKDIIKLENPTGKILSEWTRPNGLHFQKISVPIGVIGVIYESRPNVTVDASAIAMKAGNEIICGNTHKLEASEIISKLPWKDNRNLDHIMDL